MTGEIVAVALAVPLHRNFDYAVPETLRGRLRPGLRVRVPFGRRQRAGVVVEVPREGPVDGLRAVEAALEDEPLLPRELLDLCRWAAEYYRHPLGEVLHAALPPGLRDAAGPRRRRARGDDDVAGPIEEPPALTTAQAEALDALPPAGAFGVALLEGVTGSGKTELYLRRIGDVLALGGQALLLVPEIGLTPQLAGRLRARFGAGVAAFHSGASERERREAWLGARNGTVRVIVGTRSAVFVPFAHLGVIVVDEEHDVSYKQQDGFRYSARDLALLRAQRLGIPAILGTATPALETLHNAASGRYRHVRLPERVTGAAPPRVALVDVRGQRLQHGLSSALLEAVQRHVDAGGQALLFQNRRGFAPVLLCHDCGWTAPCRNCDARPTVHRRRGLLICHHCAHQQVLPTTCPSCGTRALVALGQGTERIEDALRNLFPLHRVERFDSDRLAQRSELARLLADVEQRAVHILVGTQILAKGHDFAGVSLVGIVDADQALFGTDFRAVERMGQLVTQVAGRAGRAGQPAEVLLQTHEPDHPVLQSLVGEGYGALCRQLLEERRIAGLPPFAHLALLRAESVDAGAPLAFLTQARELAQADADSRVQVFTPVPAPMERRAGRFRAQLLLQAATRGPLQQRLGELIPKLDRLPLARRTRWSVDVDPVDLY